jgi:hypothetical protein
MKTGADRPLSCRDDTMMKLPKIRDFTQLLAVTLCMVFAGSPASAAEQGARPSGGSGHAVAGGQHLDGRFAHNHYYLNRGTGFRTAPRGAYSVTRGRDQYRYDGGHWYGRGGPGWVVGGAPLGAFVTLLPPFYTTVWFGGLPYYYANETYYRWSGDNGQYEVVAPPDGIEAEGTTEAPASDTIFVYPRNDQPAELQSKDRFECHQYAVTQTGYDPTQPSGGAPAGEVAAQQGDYFRAAAACLDARGYSVR